MSTDNQYADRDAMWLDQQGGHYIRHVDHMTREGLHSKSDIAAELGWRDLQIQELTQQLSAKTISEQNIINAFGISGEGAHSKLVIEYVSGLVAERDALKAENCIQDFIITAVKDLVRDSRGVIGWHLNGDVASWDEVLPELSHSETPATEAAIAEIKAQGVDIATSHIRREQARSEMISDEISEAFSGAAEDLVYLSANLRAGRKG